ncbi:hypothetical protein KC361_g59 [Hortaea werneckii]|nr:hypothetical protein KC361_g59 [Hortaea werneckii]
MRPVQNGQATALHDLHNPRSSDGRPTMSHSHLGKHKQNPKSTNQYANNSQWKEPLAQVPEAGKMVDDVLDLEAPADEQE